MDLNPYVDRLRRELVVAAAAGGDEAQALAERLVAPLETSSRMALLEALSAAADEITSDLAPGSVELRLRGRDPEFVVTPPPAEPPPSAGGGADAPPDQRSLRAALANAVEVTMGVRPPATAQEPEDGGTSRITLRLPEYLKPRIDDAASRAGLSVNAWLVRVIASALDPGAPVDAGPGAPGGFGAPGGSGGPGAPAGSGGGSLGRQYTGWVR